MARHQLERHGYLLRPLKETKATVNALIASACLTGAIQFLHLWYHGFPLDDTFTTQHQLYCLVQTVLQALLILFLDRAFEKFFIIVLIANSTFGVLLQNKHFWVLQLSQLVLCIVTAWLAITCTLFMNQNALAEELLCVKTDLANQAQV